MNVYNTRLDAVLNIIKISQLNAKEFEEVTDLTRSRLYSWRSGKVKNINTGTAEGVAGKLGYTLSTSKNGIRASKIDENHGAFVDRSIKPELEALKNIVLTNNLEIEQLEKIKKLIDYIICKNDMDDKYVKVQKKYNVLLKKYSKLSKEHN